MTVEFSALFNLKNTSVRPIYCFIITTYFDLTVCSSGIGHLVIVLCSFEKLLV